MVPPRRASRAHSGSHTGLCDRSTFSDSSFVVLRPRACNRFVVFGIFFFFLRALFNNGKNTCLKITGWVLYRFVHHRHAPRLGKTKTWEKRGQYHLRDQCDPKCVGGYMQNCAKCFSSGQHWYRKCSGFYFCWSLIISSTKIISVPPHYSLGNGVTR